jgi:hypothetical protein
MAWNTDDWKFRAAVPLWRINYCQSYSKIAFLFSNILQRDSGKKGSQVAFQTNGVQSFEDGGGGGGGGVWRFSVKQGLQKGKTEKPICCPLFIAPPITSPLVIINQRWYCWKFMATGSLFLGIDSSWGIDFAVELIPRGKQNTLKNLRMQLL